MNKEQLITNYKASAYVFSQFILRAEVDTIENITETEKYFNLLCTAKALAKIGIKVNDPSMKTVR